MKRRENASRIELPPLLDLILHLVGQSCTSVDGWKSCASNMHMEGQAVRLLRSLMSPLLAGSSSSNTKRLC